MLGREVRAPGRSRRAGSRAPSTSWSGSQSAPGANRLERLRCEVPRAAGPAARTPTSRPCRSPRLPTISKYWTVWRSSAPADRSSVYRKLVPSIGSCVDPVDVRGLRNARRLQHGRGDVDAVRELGADLVSAGSAPARPRPSGRGSRRDGWPSACPTGTGCCRHAPRPRRNAGRCGRRRAPRCRRSVSISSSCWSASSTTPLRNVISLNEPVIGALHAGAVVAPDVEDQRVVEVAHLLDRVEQSPDVPVGVLREPGEHLHLPGVELLLRVGERVPRREQLRALGQLGVLRNDPELLLALERLLAVARPSPRRTCPCTCPPTPWPRGAGHGLQPVE